MYVHNVPKCMSYHKATVVITREANRFYDFTYIYIYISRLYNIYFMIISYIYHDYVYIYIYIYIS